jgi:type VI secretion system protein ImpK
MRKNQMKVIECFSPMIIYTLHFKENIDDPVFTVDKLVEDYKLLIEQSQKEFSAFDEKNDFYDFLYPLIAWIDENILISNFKDKKLWRKHLLQKTFFNTTNAGDDFFTKLQLFTNQDFELRIIYLYCLSLGFKGRYYYDKDKVTLEHIFKQQEDILKDSFPQKFPQTIFKNAYALNPILKKKKFQASYKNLWLTILITCIVGVGLFYIFDMHLNNILFNLNFFDKGK